MAERKKVISTRDELHGLSGTKTHVSLGDRANYTSDILPEDEATLDRTIVLGRASRVDGLIYGKHVTLNR